MTPSRDDTIVFGVRADKLDEYAAKAIGHMTDEAVLVAADVENDSIVRHEIHGRAELALHVSWCLPARFRHGAEPCTQRAFGLRMPLPEPPKRPASDDLHDEI